MDNPFLMTLEHIFDGTALITAVVLKKNKSFKNVFEMTTFIQ